MKLTRRTLVPPAASPPLSPSPPRHKAGYPNKPIRVIVPFAAGSTTDIIARAITDKMGQSMGQTLVIENRGGASGTIGQAGRGHGRAGRLHDHGPLVVAHGQPAHLRQAAVRHAWATSRGSRRSPPRPTCW